MDNKRTIEAILFMSSKPVPLDQLAKAIGVAAVGFVKAIIADLTQEYESRGSAITILEESPNNYMMTIRKDYLNTVKAFAKEAYFTRDELKVLAYVSQKQPLLKSELAKTLGGQIYPAVKELIAKGFMEARKAGRTSSLKLTKKFDDYFSGMEKRADVADAPTTTQQPIEHNQTEQPEPEETDVPDDEK